MSTPDRSPSGVLRAELQDMGLTDAIIHQVVVRGETERDTVSPLDAPIRGGMNAYCERVLAIRELLAGHGWTADNSKNLCTVVSPCERHAIVVVSGDHFTGLEKANPQPKYPRGTATAYAVNKSQLSLFGEDEEQDGEEAKRALWFLLVYRHPGESEARVELSLPDTICEKGTVVRWIERNRLDPVDLTTRVEIDDEEFVEEDVEVAVVRKA